MNSIILNRFRSHQSRLIGNTAVSHFTILVQKVSEYDGRIRIRAELGDGGLLEFAEYLELDHNGRMLDHVYSFHWQDADNQLIQRWDNANHNPALPHAPHHIHHTNGTVAGNPELPTLTAVLAAIESELIMNNKLGIINNE